MIHSSTAAVLAACCILALAGCGGGGGAGDPDGTAVVADVKLFPIGLGRLGSRLRFGSRAILGRLD